MESTFSTKNYGIFPLGDYDFIETAQTLEEYPRVVDLGITVDCDLLYKEFLNMKKPPKDFYYLSMAKKFKIDPDIVTDNFQKLNFTKENYGGYSFRRTGQYTNKIIDNLPVKIFRKHFSLAMPGWLSEFHQDHERFDTHGFRLVIPVNVDAYIKYRDGDFRLERGKMYFWNIVKEHAGWNPTDVERVLIMAQMNSDILIKHGTEILPI